MGYFLSWECLEVYQADLCLKNIFGRFDPFHSESELFDGVDERSYVASNMIEQMDRRHCKLDVAPIPAEVFVSLSFRVRSSPRS